MNPTQSTMWWEILFRFANSVPPNVSGLYSEHYELGCVIKDADTKDRVTDILLTGLKNHKTIGLDRPIQYFDIISLCTGSPSGEEDSGVRAASFVVVSRAYANATCPATVKLYGSKAVPEYVVLSINPFISFRS